MNLFRKVAIRYLGRDRLNHVSDADIDRLVRSDNATLMADMDISAKEFENIIKEYQKEKKRKKEKKYEPEENRDSSNNGTHSSWLS